MPNRSKDWLAQAKRDLNHAVHACKDEDFEWSCFSAQQGEGWGRSAFALLKALSNKVKVPQKLLEAAKILDKHYIPTRYPNGFERGIPADYYTKREAQEAIKNAR